MITVAAIAGIATVVTISGSSLFCAPVEVAKPEVFTLDATGGTITISQGSHAICIFEQRPSLPVVSNLYRSYGSVRRAGTSKAVAQLFRNTVGNGGYIEVEETPSPSMLLNLLARFQPNKEELPPIRIYVSSKLVGGIYELKITGQSAKYLWSVDEGQLVQVDGTNSVVAAKLVAGSSSKHELYVHTEVINRSLAICACIFCFLQSTRRML